MPKGQLSRVPLPGNSWMPFTFQPALQVLQQPHKHSHGLELAVYIEHYIKVTRPPCLFQLPPWGKCKQLNNSNLPYVSDIILLNIHERNYAISSMLCFLLKLQLHTK